MKNRTLKGLSVDVFTDGRPSDVISSKQKRFICVDMEGPFEIEPGEPYLKLVSRDLPQGEYKHLVVFKDGKEVKPAGSIGPMFGGNFAYSSDSRFRKVNAYPLPIHDLHEIQIQD